jgi:ribonucleotide monophosphatase NagD (HAD superfamily)
LLIDLSGTLHIGSNPTPGAVEALRKLRSAQIPFRFCSNTSKESTTVLCDTLRKIGFDVNTHHAAQQEVWTSIGAVKKLLVELGLKR